MQQERDLEWKARRQFRALWMMITVLYLLQITLFATIIVLEFKIGLLH